MKLEFKNPFGKKPAVSDKDYENTRKLVRDAQREFEHQSKKYEAEMAKLRELVAQASLLDKDSAEYKTLQHQAMGYKQKADAYEKGMRSAYTVLEKNRKFENMLENGMTLSRLNNMLPQPETAEKLLQKISDIAQELNDKTEELTDIFQDFSEEIDSFIPTKHESEFSEFDAMVNAHRAKITESIPTESAHFDSIKDIASDEISIDNSLEEFEKTEGVIDDDPKLSIDK